MRLRTLNLYEAIFPHQLRHTLWQSGMSVAGILMMALASALGTALMSWSAADPSLSHATEALPTNWLGAPGAIIADLMVQFFGISSIAPVMMIAGWGWRLTSGRRLTRPLIRLSLTIVAMVVLAGYLSSLETPEHWQLLVGMGGVLGDAAKSWINLPPGFVAGAFGSSAEVAVAAILALLALFCLAYASDISLPRGRGKGAGSPDKTGDEDRSGQEIGLARFLFMAVVILIRIFDWLLRRVFRLLVELRSLLRRLTGSNGIDGIDPKDRLHLAMERAGRDDLTWSSTSDVYAANQLRRPAADIDQTNGEAEHTQEHFGGGLVGRARAFIRELWDDSASADPLEALPRSEPQLEPAMSPPNDGDEFSSDVVDTAPESVERKPRARKRASAAAIPDEPTAYPLPPLTLLNEAPPARREDTLTREMLVENAHLLEGVLDDFGIRGQIIDVRPGPVVTLYELEPAPGLKSSRVIGLADDIARSMSAISARVAVVPCRNAIGIELPNDRRLTVYLHEVFASKHFSSDKHTLALTLGKNIGGEPIIVDLARMPHLLIAGTTGSGKSVGINAMILSLLYRMTPEECRMIMIDPKMLELSVYDGIPHLLTPVVTDPNKAIVALKWAVREMEARYKNMSKVGVRNIDGFNKRAREAAAKGETLTRTVQTGFDRETGEAIYETEEITLEPMPYIVVVVDEMADLMMVAGKDIEGAIQRLAQMARAAGIHIVMATQRPSVDVITGTIKANFPTRISFQVTSKIDSRTILGEQGAEQLLGQGDMLFMAGGGRISRVHGAFVTDEEVETVVQFLKRQGVPEYLDAVTADNENGGGPGGDFMSGFDAGEVSQADQLYDQAVAIVARDRKASTSYIQRRLSIGYNRAATLIERMENEGVVGPANHAGKREILAPEPGFGDD